MQRTLGFWKSPIVTIVTLFLLAILLAFFLTSFIFQQYEVDGPSMQPTLQNNDRLVVIKIARTWARITGHAYVPKRGDIIIFNESGLFTSSGQQEKQLVKRVVGLPGERVVVANGVLTIFNKQYPNGFDPDKTLPYGQSLNVVTGNDVDTVLGANQIFVCGDNRPDSLDSRYFGPVNVNNIIGKLDLRIYPFTTIKLF